MPDFFRKDKIKCIVLGKMPRHKKPFLLGSLRHSLL